MEPERCVRANLHGKIVHSDLSKERNGHVTRCSVLIDAFPSRSPNAFRTHTKAGEQRVTARKKPALI
eukprot:8122990-Prorocentrum_lima.AAC.1